MTSAVWLQMYQLQQWISFDKYVICFESFWLVPPLYSCTCSNSLKYYICKYPTGLAIMFNQFEVNDKTRSQMLGKRRTNGRSKKFELLYHHHVFEKIIHLLLTWYCFFTLFSAVILFSLI